MNEIDILKIDLNLKYPYNNKNLIYLRVSKEDKTQQDPLKDALDKLKSDFYGLIEKYPTLKKEGFKLYIEISSAYTIGQKEFEQLCREDLFLDSLNITDIFFNRININKNLYVSSFDRISRNFLNSLSFQLIRKLTNVKVYSLLEEEANLENNNLEIKDKDNSSQLMYIFQLMMFSSMASKHSQDFGAKVKKRVTKNKAGKTISSKSGKDWGRIKTISKDMRERIIERNKRFSYREISEQADIYQVVKRVKKTISEHTIKKICLENR